MATFKVTQATDNGKGNIEGSLSYAILKANQTPGADTIDIQKNVRLNLNSDLKRMQTLVNSNLTIKGNNHTISGDNNNNGIVDLNGEDRPILFIKSGNVNVEDVTFEGGVAKGGDSKQGGAGAGMGGALFIYSGDVNLTDVNFDNNQAIGGSNVKGFYGSGGGMGGNAISNSLNGGGLFGGDYGGNGNYSGDNFGKGGDAKYYSSAGGNGGFGGGGCHGDVFYYQNYYSYYKSYVGGVGGDGGFGGGGGSGAESTNFGGVGGDGGFGGGGGYGFYYPGVAGFGGGDNGGGGAGMGGAVFVRSGNLNLNNVAFNNNSATGGTSEYGDNGKGLGGAIFVIDQAAETAQKNQGNIQGMPETLAIVNANGVVFSNNTASDDAGTDTNNDDVYGVEISGDNPPEPPIEGTSGDDILIGTASDNEMIGFGGNDLIKGKNGEDLIKGGNGNDRLFGQGNNDTLIGGNGNDRLIGGLGNDKLTGGAGADKFIFYSPLDKVDTLVDFDSTQGDQLRIDASGFGGGLSWYEDGLLPIGRFVIGTGAQDSYDRFIYNNTNANGQLFYDVDGKGGENQVKITTFIGAPELNASDIYLF